MPVPYDRPCNFKYLFSVAEAIAVGMEERMNQAIEFKDQTGFRRSLFQYIRHLSTHTLESRLKEVQSQKKLAKCRPLWS